MFKRLLKAFAIAIGFLMFPIVFVYQFIEFIAVAPIYWIITGNKYTDTYDTITFVWMDLMEGNRTLKGLSFKNRLTREFWEQFKTDKQ